MKLIIKTFAAILIIALVSSNALALGITPGRTTLDFEPGKIHNGKLKIVNNVLNLIKKLDFTNNLEFINGFLSGDGSPILQNKYCITHHIVFNPNEKVFNKNFPALITLKAHSSVAIKALLASDLKKRTEDKSFLSGLALAHKKIREEQKSHQSSSRISPSRFFETCQKIMDENAIYVTDSGNGTFLANELSYPPPNYGHQLIAWDAKKEL